MARPVWTLASGDYDRVRALWDGTLVSERFDLNVLRLTPDVIFSRMVNELAFEASEMSLATYLVLLSRGNPPFVAIPAFPSRKFRHGDIYVRRDSALHTPADLKGLPVGVPEYQLTAFVWLRGMFMEEYGVAPADIAWRVGGLDAPGRKDKVPLTLPPEFDVSPIGPDDTLTALLLDGKIDAILSPKAPEGFLPSGGAIRRLYADQVSEEKAYYARTGIFPPIHTVVLRRDVYEADPAAARELYDLYLAAKRACFERYRSRMALAVSVPWFDDVVDQAMAMMGQDYWAYGVRKNENALNRFLCYMRQQGLLPSDYHPTPSELFVPETRDT